MYRVPAVRIRVESKRATAIIRAPITEGNLGKALSRKGSFVELGTLR
jgi:hypothetical protein